MTKNSLYLSHSLFLPFSWSLSPSPPNKWKTQAPMEVLPPWELTTHLLHGSSPHISTTPFITSSIHLRLDCKELGVIFELGKLGASLEDFSSRVCFYLLISFVFFVSLICNPDLGNIVNLHLCNICMFVLKFVWVLFHSLPITCFNLLLWYPCVWRSKLICMHDWD